MDVRKVLFIFVIVYLFCALEARKHHHKNQAKQNGTSLSVGIKKGSNRVYSAWTPWTKCSHKCKKRRYRQCIDPSVCGTRIMTESRSCHEAKCAKRKIHSETGKISEKISNGENSTTAKKFNILFNMPQLMSEWSEWSECSKDCTTTRTQRCLVPEACGHERYSDTAICYMKGTECETIYGSRRSRKKSGTKAVGMDVMKLPFTGYDCGRAPLANSSIDLRDKLRIIGGRESKHGMWPWQVALLNRHREPFCGGTLIAPNWVLTAAHCERKRLFVRSGEHNLQEPENSEQERMVSRIFSHPQYNLNTVSNDIALLKLRKPLRFNDHTQPACLPKPEDQLEASVMATILGWGKSKSTAIYGTDQLHQAEVPIVSLEECRQTYPHYEISEKMTCAGYKQGRIDSCAGDSGGPLLYQQNNKWTVFGVTSFGDGCGKKGKFGIYSNVPKFINWIRRTVARYN